MQQGGVQTLQLVVILLLLFVVVFGALARKLATPYPLVLVIAGLALTFIPGIPRITLDPDLIFFVVLPPLLFAGAWTTSWRDFSYNLVSILSLTIGLVAFTVLGVAFTARWLFAGFDWRLGIVLGAVVAPTDAIAATSIARRLGLPRRIVDVLEGESLLNDATGLLALEFGIAMVVYGQTPGIGAAALRLCWLSAGGIGIGLLIGRLVGWLELHIDDAPIEITISILVPYAAYLAAQAVRASGVLAVVASGLYLSRQSTRFFSPPVRIQAYAVWNALSFILNGAVFALVGLALPYVLAGIRGQYGLPSLLLYGALFSAGVVLLRLLWVFPGARMAYFIRRRLLGQKEQTPGARSLIVVGWTGMRGVIALAASMSLPQTLSDGSPFPQRNLIIFLTFCVIVVTLVGQGLSLPAVIRALGLAGDQGARFELLEARRIVLEAALRRIEEARGKDDRRWAGLYDDLAQHYRARLEALSGSREGKAPDAYRKDSELERELLQVERETAIRLRNEGRISDDVLRQIEQDLDLREARLMGGLERDAVGSSP
ncbi:MAG TPA: Na+/H+ antiporter [Myxococcales bacterium]|nr:Na+/H+ antiporter [Myxococcales bacterium]